LVGEEVVERTQAVEHIQVAEPPETQDLYIEQDMLVGESLN